MQELSKNKLYEIEKVANFKELINRSASLYSKKTAFIYKLNPKSKEYITHSYLDLQNDVKSLGTALLDLGLSGKRIAIIAPNRYEWCISYLSITTSRYDCCSFR